MMNSMNEHKFLHRKKACLLLALFFWGVQVFIEFFGSTILVKLFPRELLIEYLDPVFYGTFFLVNIIIFRKIFWDSIKDFVKKYDKYLDWTAIFGVITLVLMVGSAIMLDAVGVGKSANQEFIDEVVVQYGLLHIVILCFVGPVVEEVFYRGILYEVFAGSKREVLRSILAVVLSSLVFAFMHVSHIDFSFYDLFANIPILMLGLTLAALRWKADNILCPILVHIVINSIGTLA